MIEQNQSSTQSVIALRRTNRLGRNSCISLGDYSSKIRERNVVSLKQSAINLKKNSDLHLNNDIDFVIKEKKRPKQINRKLIKRTNSLVVEDITRIVHTPRSGSYGDSTTDVDRDVVIEGPKLPENLHDK